VKLTLTYRQTILGEILPEKASLKTKEVKGLLIPTVAYQKIRSSINKYNEIFQESSSKNLIDKTLDKLLQTKYKDLKTMFSELTIELGESKITNEKSEIRIIDNLSNTGLGNPIIYVESRNLDINAIEKEFELYDFTYKYPSNPNQIIEIKKSGKKNREY